MSRKHYVAIADALRFEHLGIDTLRADGATRLDQYRRDVKAIADVLAADNGRFDRGRFYRACGLDGAA